MRGYGINRLPIAAHSRRWVSIAVIFVGVFAAHAQESPEDPAGKQDVSIDRVIAIVNRQTILASDLEDELQISILDPSRNLVDKETPQQALDRLISRALIQQQIRQGDIGTPAPTAEEVANRLQELRTELPTCVRANCQSDAGWKAFLDEHNLTTSSVQNYIRSRIEILRFIELRFRQGIRITPEEIESYYREKLLPQYPAGVTPPPLQQVSARIEEILLQQRVNDLFSSWLANLRKQGQIQILAPELASTADEDTEAGGKQ